MKKFLTITLILWPIVFIASFVFDKSSVPFFQRAIFSLGFSALGVLWFFHQMNGKENAGVSTRSHDTGLISCRNCGFFGGSHGACPKCGSTKVDKIKSDSSVISCRQCGFIGVGYGRCPRCNSGMVEKLNSDASMISCGNCGYRGTGNKKCPRCNSSLVKKIR